MSTPELTIIRRVTPTRFGPNTIHVVEYVNALYELTDEQWDAARDAARDAAWDAARAAAWDAARAAAWDAARAAAWAAARAAARAAEALTVRDLITAEDYKILTEPMRAAGIVFPLHRDDMDEAERAVDQARIEALTPTGVTE